jgi:pyruvate dehydrogenase E1 component alpha subunit
MRKITAQFQIPYLQILDEKGNVDHHAMPRLSPRQIRELFEWMVFARIFDDITLRLQREGRMGTYPPMVGEEAAIVGTAYAMKRNDWLFWSYRENAAAMMKGVPVDRILLYWASDVRGMRWPMTAHAGFVTIPIATQLPHAVGFAWAAKMKGENYATVVMFGDGATSKGDFYESLNFAGTFKIPVVFVCRNDQYAISVPRSLQTKAETIAQKSLAAGITHTIQVDGNDIFAVYSAVSDAIASVKKGSGPAFVECITYRRSHHTTADDWTHYRTAHEVETWQRKDPIDRLRIYMKEKRLWNARYEKRLVKQMRRKVDDAVKKMEAVRPADPKEMFTSLFEKPTPDLVEQIKESGL